MTGPMTYDLSIKILDFTELYLDTVIKQSKTGNWYIFTGSENIMDPGWLWIGGNSIAAAGSCLFFLAASPPPENDDAESFRFPDLTEIVRGVAVEGISGRWRRPDDWVGAD